MDILHSQTMNDFDIATLALPLALYDDPTYSVVASFASDAPELEAASGNTGPINPLDVTAAVQADYANDGANAVAAFRMQVRGDTASSDGIYLPVFGTAVANPADRPTLTLEIVPEPSSLVLLTFASLGCLVIRRSRC